MQSLLGALSSRARLAVDARGQLGVTVLSNRTEERLFQFETQLSWFYFTFVVNLEAHSP
jgi:hypothetical protein